MFIKEVSRGQQASVDESYSFFSVDKLKIKPDSIWLSKSGFVSGPFYEAGPRYGYGYGSATCTHEVLSLLQALFFFHQSIRPTGRKEAETVSFHNLI
jgi:hypothetical protein